MLGIVLYDLPSRDPLHCWSPNPWKTRMLLSYKKLDYVTLWIEYTQIGPTFKNVGIPANKEGIPYTVPTVRFQQTESSNPEWIMDSKAIATRLEEAYPSPTLHLDSPILVQVEGLVAETQKSLAPVITPRTYRNLLNEMSQPFFARTRYEWYGMSLDDFEKQKGGDQAWENAAPTLKALAELLNATSGPYFMGEMVSYADFNLVAYFQFGKRVGDDVFDRLMQVDESFPKLYHACEEWLQRSNR